jgi:hypothetical protein
MIQYVIVLTMLIDNKPVMTMPLSSERFNSYVTCTYYAIDAKNQLGILLKETAGSAYTVDWACKQTS